MQAIRQFFLRLAAHRPLRPWLARAAEPHIVFPAIAFIVLGVIWITALQFVRVERAGASQAAAASSEELAATYEAQVVPIDQAEGSVAREEFYTRFLGKSPAQVKAYWAKIIFTGRGQPPKEVASSIEVKKRVAENPNAIGYIDQSHVDESVRVLQSP